MDGKEQIYEYRLKLIEQGEFAKLKEELNDDNPANIAEFFEDIPEEKQLFVFRLLTKDNGADTFSFMDSDMQERIVASITDNEIRHIVDELSLDDAVDFLSEIPANLVTRVLKNTDSGKRKLINQFLNYPDDCAGSIMTIEFVQFHHNITVQTAMEQLRRTGLNKETIYSCYVVDARRVLVGMVSLRRLILADDDKTVEEIMEEDVIFTRTLDDQEDVANLFKKYNVIALPVVDNEKRLVGIITVDDIVDVLEEESTEDMEKMAALIPADEQYLKTSVFKLSNHRNPWLLVLMISSTLSSIIIQHYDELLASVIVLTSFFPILMGTGGNAGSQASTLIIRGMAVGEIETRDVLKVVYKELRVGLLAGSALGVINYLRLMLLGDTPWNINLTVSLSMAIIVVFSKTIGCSLPIAAKKLRFDPAIMAAPLITTIVDCLALVVFFTIATILVL